jgi:glycosyltransferase involved in cell wall biosynthesis
MVSYLSQGLAARGIAVEVITRQPDPPCARSEQLGLVRVRRLRPAGLIKGSGWSAIPRLLAFLLRLGLLLLRDRRKYDVLIVSGMKVIPLVAMPAARLLGKRCFIRAESTFEVLEPISAESIGRMNGHGHFFAAVAKRLQQWTLRRADCLIAVSEEIAQLLERAGVPRPRIARIPNAVDLEKFHPVSRDQQRELRAHLGLPIERTIAVFAGRLSAAKGVMSLIAAWPELLTRWTDLHLVFVGTGRGSFDDCETMLADNIRSLGIERHVQMVGASDTVHRYLQAADFSVLPSRYEGFGLGIIEALGCGLPLVVTPVGVARELIRHDDNGFLVPIDDSATLGRTLNYMLEQRERWPEIGRRARSSVARYSLGAIIEQYVALCAPNSNCGTDLSTPRDPVQPIT